MQRSTQTHTPRAPPCLPQSPPTNRGEVMTRNSKVARTPKAPAKAKRVKKAKSETRTIEHRSLGECIVLGVFLTDGGGIVVDTDVAGARRTLSLAQEFWFTLVDVLRLEAVK